MLDESGDPALLKFEVVYNVAVLWVDAAVDVEGLVDVLNIANLLRFVNTSIIIHRRLFRRFHED